MQAIRTLAAAALIVGSGLALPSAQAQQPGIKRTDLQRHDLSAPGREAVQARVDIGPGAAFPRHRHPGEEIIYVIEGSLIYEIDGQPPVTLKAGEVLFIPAGTVHAAKNAGTVNAAELATDPKISRAVAPGGLPATCCGCTPCARTSGSRERDRRATISQAACRPRP